MPKKFYAVKSGRKTGIFRTWSECQAATSGYPGALFKGFETADEADAYLGRTAYGEAGGGGNSVSRDEWKNGKNGESGGNSFGKGRGKDGVRSGKDGMKSPGLDSIYEADAYAFVDGSFNKKTGVYGYGGFLCRNDSGERTVLQGSGSDAEMAGMWNVAGEISGSMKAVELALKMGSIGSLAICYDYQGIESWAVGDWKRNKKGTEKYYLFMQEAMKKLDIRFVKVRGHSGVEGNEEADRLARQAAGID